MKNFVKGYFLYEGIKSIFSLENFLRDNENLLLEAKK